MGKRIISQRRGRGTTTYRSHSFRWGIEVKHRKYDDIEKSSVIRGRVIDLVNSKGHTAPLASIKYENGEMNFVFAPEGIKVNDFVESGSKAEEKSGNTLPLKSIQVGTVIYNIELTPGDGGKLCRTSGNSAKLVSNLLNTSIVQLPSKKQKKLDSNCRATIGAIAGKGRIERSWGKVGKRHYAMRARGKLYPRTSAVSMNAVDHPFGYGRGKQHAKIKVASPFAPPGRKVGKVGSRRTGRK